jgi:hypothetical protein
MEEHHYLGYECNPLRIPSDADHDSEMMAIAIPTGSRSLFGGSRNGDRHRRNHFLKLSS